ncbi:hypothetical protein EYR41_006078 [Orbilia oligospora]|uniref:DUF7770 domain-containing protein n=1 Tax=Orbilia oligospora TaxID=2813651 RepID=A0A8H2E422_ORBOL|nr:hypothetical protein EYR41_006078 [Orbilia oligospora]
MDEVIPESSIVKDVRVVVQKTGAIEDGRSVNHWSITLLLEGSKSVRLNMRNKTSEEWLYELPENAEYGEPGVLDITVHDYVRSFSTIYDWDYHCAGQHTVRDFINVLLQKNRQYYTMAIGGSGCRYWVYVVMLDFAAEGFVQETVPDDLHTNLMNYYTGRGDSIVFCPTDTMPKGKFWSAESWEAEFRACQ